jgi:hypothetical protein
LRYQPSPRLFVVLKGIYAEKGEDSETVNYGGNILKDYNTGRNEYGNKVSQGIPSNILYGEASLSFMLKHNFWIEFRQIFRNNDTPLTNKIKNTNYSFAAIRWNIPSRTYEY